MIHAQLIQLLVSHVRKIISVTLCNVWLAALNNIHVKLFKSISVIVDNLIKTGHKCTWQPEVICSLAWFLL